jgi:hypothetical protein
MFWNAGGAQYEVSSSTAEPGGLAPNSQVSDLVPGSTRQGTSVVRASNFPSVKQTPRLHKLRLWIALNEVLRSAQSLRKFLALNI